jgi:hypothetical protein
MYSKLAITVVLGFLPFITLGDDTNMKSSETSSPALSGVTNQEPRALRLNVTCRSGAVVILDNAALLERGVRTRGSIPESTRGTTPPTVRLVMPGAGAVSIPWDDIEKIIVGERGSSQKAYPIEVVLKNTKATKIGETIGPDNTLVGLSDDGEFSIQLKDVVEITVLPPSETN